MHKAGILQQNNVHKGYTDETLKVGPSSRELSRQIASLVILIDSATGKHMVQVNRRDSSYCDRGAD